MHNSGVLIVEHDERVSRVLCRIIERMGYEPMATADYEDFKVLYKEKTPEIIMLSLEITDTNDSELFRFLTDQQSQSAIILLSNLDEEDLGKFEELGRSGGLNMGGVLRKPVDFNSVKELLSGPVLVNRSPAIKENII
jgi:DNA-binding response OmpR family regulator